MISCDLCSLHTEHSTSFENTMQHRYNTLLCNMQNKQKQKAPQVPKRPLKRRDTRSSAAKRKQQEEEEEDEVEDQEEVVEEEEEEEEEDDGEEEEEAGEEEEECQDETE